MSQSQEGRVGDLDSPVAGVLGYGESELRPLNAAVRGLLWAGIAYGLARSLFTVSVWYWAVASGREYELLVQIVSGLAGGSDLATTVQSTLPAIGGISLCAACLLVLLKRRGRAVILLLGAAAFVLACEPWLINFASLPEMIHMARLSGLVQSNVLNWFIQGLGHSIALSALPLLIAILAFRRRIR